MTKEKIIEIIIEIMRKHWHQDGYYTASFDSDGCAGELFSLIEQEKRGVAQEMCNDLKGLLEGYINTNENITLYEYCCNKYGVKHDETRDN